MQSELSGPGEGATRGKRTVMLARDNLALVTRLVLGGTRWWQAGGLRGARTWQAAGPELSIIRSEAALLQAHTGAIDGTVREPTGQAC